jgi:phage gp29-like protein
MRIFMGNRSRKNKAITRAAHFSKPESLSPELGELATRTSMGDYFASFYNAIDNPDPVLRKTGQSLAVYREIKRDPHVKTCLISRKAGTTKRNWDISGGTDKANAEIEAIFNDLNMLQIIKEILDASFMGHQVQEVIWDKIGSMIVPTGVVAKPQEWFYFDIDNQLMRRKTANALEGVPVEDRKFLLTQYEADYLNPYGEGAASECFWPVTFKKGGVKYWALFLQKFGIPHALGQLPPDASPQMRSDMLSALGRMIRDAVAVFPENSTVKLLETTGTSGTSDLYLQFAKYHDGEISKVILGHSAAADSTPGKLGGEDNTLSVREDLIDSDVAMVESTLNKLIRWIQFYNPTTIGSDLPKITLSPKDKIDKSLAERDKIITEGGYVKLTKKYLKEKHGFQDDDILVDETPPSPRAPISAGPQFAAPMPVNVGETDADLAANQDAVDTMSKQATSTMMAAFMEELLKPVYELQKNANSFAEFSKARGELYSKMDEKKFQEILEKSGLYSMLLGRSTQ